MKAYDDCIVFLLAKAYQKAHSQLKKRLSPYGLTPIQSLILADLWGEDGISASEIGKRLTLDPATLSGVVDRMISGGWIGKISDPEDKRIHRIFLTEKSKTLQPDILAERNQANEDVLEQMNVEEKMLFKRLLREVQK
ncbi:MAG: MarR family transcriptional regulator [Deltaproteobacteria bacterium]|nr:MarR family transcriptional regulator [Deltaproteobacteria bacterium]